MVSSVTVFIATSILFFFIGFFCGHSCRKQSTVSTGTGAVEKLNTLQDDLQPRQLEDDLELKTNVVYGLVSQQ